MLTFLDSLALKVRKDMRYVEATSDDRPRTVPCHLGDGFDRRGDDLATLAASPRFHCQALGLAGFGADEQQLRRVVLVHRAFLVHPGPVQLAP